ncbi:MULTISPECIES: hypothetical protein [Arthrobacter]|nr:MULTISPECIES: hypothetical protein [Arthrobacter]
MGINGADENPSIQWAREEQMTMLRLSFESMRITDEHNPDSGPSCPD